LLLTKNLAATKHAQLRSLLHREYVKTGIISVEMGKFYDLLFDNRQKGDYSDFISFDVEQVSEWFVKAHELIEFIDRIIKMIK